MTKSEDFLESILPDPNLKLLPPGHPSKPFLDFAVEEKPSENVWTKTRSTKLFTVILSALAFLLGSGLWYSINYASVTPPQVAISPTTSNVAGVSDEMPTLDASSSATTSGKVVSYKMEILNGSGISGQAATLKQALASDQFSQVTTGNADTKTDTTDLALSENIPSSVKQSLLNSLNKLYSDVQTISLDKSSKFDVVITTGKPKL